MILTLAQSVTQKVAELHQRSRSLSDNQKIQNTGLFLDRLKNRSKQISDSIVLIKPRFSAGDRKTIISLVREVKKQLGQSQSLFESEYNQLAPLKEMEGGIKDLSDKAKEIWAQSIYSEVQPITETLKLTMKFLPETDQALIKAYYAEVKRIMGLFPVSADEATRLEVNISRLKAFSQIGVEVPPEVRAFLNKVQAGTATLLDLNEAVLKWTQKMGNADKFFITLTKG